MNVVEVFEIVRKFLGWSYRDVSMKSGKYSTEYLRQVHQGRPFPSVEKDLIMTYIQGLAERAVYLASGGQVQGSFCDKFVAKFMQVVHRNNLSLGDAKTLVERVSKDRALTAKLRTQTMDVNVGIDIIWEEILEEIVHGLNKPNQRNLFDVVDEYAEGIDLPVSDRSFTSEYYYQTRHIPAEAKAQCQHCGNIQSEAQGCRCVQCGYGSIANPNW